MKTIDIRTTQNVTITYELASFSERLLALILDSIIKGLGLFILWWLFFALFQDLAGDLAEYFAYIFIIPIFTFYTLFFEIILNGQTPGKQMMKIKVIKLNGKQPGFYDYLIRWTFRILDIFLSAGVLACMLIMSTDYAQRLGDMTSNSTVVKISTRSLISLNDILKIDTRQNYVPKFPQMGSFREEDILLIKDTIERYQRYKNKAHKNAVLLLCQKMSDRLGVSDVGSDKIGFLKTLIKDYIVLTR